MYYIASLKSRVLAAEKRERDAVAYAKLLESKLNSFFTGDVPENATLDHLLLAKAGRERLERKKKTPALLSSKQAD